MSIKRVWRDRPEPGWYYVYDIYVGGRRVRTPRGEGFPTISECRDALASIRADYRRDRYLFPADRSTLTIADLREAWAASLKQLERSHSYIARVEKSLKELADLMWPTTRILDLRTIHLHKYHTNRLTAGVKPQTIYGEIVAIMTALNNAPELFESLVDWRPPRKPKNVTQSTSGRERVITREEEAQIIETLMRPWGRASSLDLRARKQLARIFWIALRTGMREGELLGLRKTSVSFDRAIKMPNGWIDVRRSHGSEKTKTGKHRLIPMSPTVARALRGQIDQTVSAFVFPSPQTLLTRWVSFRGGFEKACELAGVPYGWDAPDGVVFHDSRHTAATRMLQGGTDIKTVGSILGHSDKYMTMRYSHATAESRQAAVRLLEDEDFHVRFESTLETDEATPVHSRPVALRA